MACTAHIRAALERFDHTRQEVRSNCRLVFFVVVTEVRVLFKVVGEVKPVVTLHFSITMFSCVTIFFCMNKIAEAICVCEHELCTIQFSFDGICS